MPQQHYEYYNIIAKRIQKGLEKEDFMRGENIEEVVVLALHLRFLITHLQKAHPDNPLLKEISWLADVLQHEANAILSSPKKDIFTYLKAYHDAQQGFLKLITHLRIHS
ncbi:hypothetical protein [Rufibacter latericius]|uniref:Uncharacterized protein n=1 Tax=Rufibacter latericius TaxID=2487040 RepID=A0A3M9MYQ8_9BACT|nr:hypothetical protein [Rufibacter latericius]RNI30664.1 hypothetical protein EFB08_05295 [Rufibacter latericius]